MSTVIVDVCNSALIKLGAEPINDISEDSKEARLCKIQFNKVLKAVLRSAPWSFAVKRFTLTPTAITPEFGDQKIFQIPVEVVRVWKIFDGTPRYKYSIEGDKLYTSSDTVMLFGVINTVDPAHWHDDFVEALACQLAADLAFALTQSNQLKAGLVSEAETWIQRARSTGSQEMTPEEFRFDEFIDARRGGRAFYE